MQDLLFHFCQWLEGTFFGAAIRNTLWGYPYIQLIHFSGLSLWIGTIATVDLRLLGWVGRRHSLTQLAEHLLPWTWTGLGMALTGGFLLFSSIATTYFPNPAFRVKLLLVLLGIGYHIFIQRKVPQWGQSPATPAVAKVAGLVELLLWIAVVTAATEIPNY